MGKDSAELKARFDDAMMNVYRRALNECHYNATRLLQMLYDHRGLETAGIPLDASGVSEGYVALWERKRLDLTVEALILATEWHSLFSEQEREITRKRLVDYGFKVGAAPQERGAAGDAHGQAAPERPSR